MQFNSYQKSIEGWSQKYSVFVYYNLKYLEEYGFFSLLRHFPWNSFPPFLFIVLMEE